MRGSKLMGNNSHQAIHAIMSGQRRGIGATLARGAARAAELPYAAAMTIRNYFYDHGILRALRLARPVISVGNITTGGTGKTPVVQWLAENLQEMQPAVLMRGYKSVDQISDEQYLLREQLPGITVIANPNRIRGAAAALAQKADTGLFILDDGMQHRKVARDFELVLIDATNPFGFAHVLPRGLLREPFGGLARANAFLITRSDLAGPGELDVIRSELNRHNPKAPIFCANHYISGFRCGEESAMPAALTGKRAFLFCGVGNPESVKSQLVLLGLNIIGSRFFPDHYNYRVADLEELAHEKADTLITTEKDWIKISQLSHAILQKIYRTELSLSFSDSDEQKLESLVRLSIARPAR
ncbi:MAG TPA: tetraacyldisaccharide 4'-kinase [Tepidisphaeraceae bacterium]|jgi:tetraacyldisaccharide 4'-kinase